MQRTTARRRDWGGRLTLLALILLTVGANASGFVAVEQEEQLLATGTQLTGRIHEVEEGVGASDRQITVHYDAPDGEQLTVRALTPTDVHPTVGEEVTVVLEPGHPEHALVKGYDTWAGFWRGLVLFLTLIFGSIFAVAGIARAAERRRARKAAAAPAVD